MIDERKAKRALMSWGVGRSFLDGDAPTGAAVVMVEDSSHVDRVLRSGAVRPGGVLFAPDADGELAFAPDADGDLAESHGVDVMAYQGTLSEPAGELSVGEDVFVQNQDYATAEYMSVIGPTLLRVLVPEDFDVLIADLDRSVAEGRFPDHLIHPAAQLADRSALGGPTALDGPRTRLHLRHDGTWSLGPFGAPLGELGDDFAALEDAWRRAADDGASVPLAGVVPEDVRAAAALSRPWLGHALSAVTALQDLAARRVLNVSVSGFGDRLNPALADHPRLGDSAWGVPDSSTPVLAWTEEDAYLHLPDRGRTFRITRDAALGFEAVIVTGSAAEAARFAPAELVEVVSARLAAEGAPLREPVA